MTRGRRGSGVLLIVVAIFTLVGSMRGMGSARAGQATPVPSAEPGSLAGMLGLAPALAADVYVPAIQLAAYADVAGQFAAVGIPRPTRFAVDDETTIRAFGLLSTLALPEAFRLQPEDDSWLPAAGFAPSQVDQILQLGAATSSLTLLRGGFNPELVRTTLLQNGYQEVAEDGLTAWTIGPDGELSPPRSGVQIGFNGLNNVAFLPDGTLVAASSLDGIRAAHAVQAGDAPSLAEDDAVVDLLAAVPATLVSAQILPGGVVARTSISDASGNPPAVDGPPLPPIRLVLFGITPGGPIRDFTQPESATPVAIPGVTTARFVVGVVFTDPAAAAAAAPIVAARLEQASGLNPEFTYADLFGDPVVTTPAGGLTVLIEAEFGEMQPGAWQGLLFVGDLRFLYWDE